MANFISKLNGDLVEGWKCLLGTSTVDDLVAPEEEEHLAINTKKAEHLRQWIRSRMAMERGPKILLLTGPCGAAKTASLRLICDELGVEVLDFDGNQQEYELNYAGDEVWESSAFRVFVQFMRSAQLSSIERMSLKHRLLLIEQLPNIFYRDVQLLHNTLAEFAHNSRCMIAIVLSSIDSCWDLNPMRLFPAPALERLAIDHIKFNAITATNMTKAVRRMFAALNWRTNGPNADVIREIVASANGDIRRATNLVDCLAVNGGVPQNTQRRISQSSQSSLLLINRSDSGVIGGGDLRSGQVETFHFIGKLMYAKRAESVDERWRRCERMLDRPCRRRYARTVPPKDDLNELISSCFVSGNFLAGYVFEHEPVFAPSVSALAAVASNVCEFDTTFGVNVEANQLLDKYALDVVARSVVFHNYNLDPKPQRRGGGLYQFSKSKLKENMGKCEEMRRATRDVFASSFLRSSDMDTLMLPMLPWLRFTCTLRAQSNLIEKLRFINKNKNGNAQFTSIEEPAVIQKMGSQFGARRLFALQKDVCEENIEGMNYTIDEVF